MSFKAYPAAWPHHTAMRAAAARWQRRGLLLPAQRAAIDAAYSVDYYQPALFLRVGLFVATLLSVGSLLVALGVMGLHSEFILGVVALVGSVAGVEMVIKNSRHYHSGVDMALLYSALLAWNFLILYGFTNLLPYSYSHRLYEQRFWLTASGTWLHLLLLLVPLLVALWRYADPVVAAITFGTALALLANVLLHGALGRLLLPFGVMVAAVALLLALRRLPTRPDYFYYRSAGLVLRTLGLAVLYLAGNYLVVREGNAELLGGGGPSGQIPLAPLFYVCTAGIPLVYIVLGLRRHDRLLLTLGLLALAFSLFTLRYYRQLLPPEIAATAGGAVLLLCALTALRYLRTPRHGLTAAADAEATPHFNLESLVVAQTAHAPSAPEAGFEFGGGQSGGGGADSSY